MSDTPRNRAVLTAKNCQGVGNSLGIDSTIGERRIHNIVFVLIFFFSSYLLEFKFFKQRNMNIHAYLGPYHFIFLCFCSYVTVEGV